MCVRITTGIIDPLLATTPKAVQHKLHTNLNAPQHMLHDMQRCYAGSSIESIHPSHSPTTGTTDNVCKTTISSILFYFILFYFISFCFVSFHFISFHFVLFCFV
jgi:hypothetical protein